MEFDEASKSILSEHGFREYKKKQYILIKEDVVFYLTFQGSKKDIYIWYSIYPLCMPKIRLGVGWGNCSGRIPEAENELSIKDDTEIINASTYLKVNVENTFLPLVSKITSIKDIANMYIAGYPAGISYLAMGDFNKGIKLLNDYKDFKESFGSNVLIEDGVLDFINNASPDNIESMLEKERQQNIKKLRLRKYIK